MLPTGERGPGLASPPKKDAPGGPGGPGIPGGPVMELPGVPCKPSHFYFHD